MDAELRPLGCLRTMLVVGGLLALCFAAGLAGQVGWLAMERSQLPTPQPSATLPPPPTITPTAAVEQTATPTREPTATATPLGQRRLSPTPRASRTATPADAPDPSPPATVEATGTATPAAPDSYTVQAGDTFFSIARRFGLSVAELAAANPTVTPEQISVGDVLQLP